MKHPVLIAGLWFMAMIVGTSALMAGCDRKLSEDELKAKLAEAQSEKAAKQLDANLTYKVVCVAGIKYYASKVITYDGQFGIFSHDYWVVGGPVIATGAVEFRPLQC